MSIGGLLQSGGIVGDIWKKAAKRVSEFQRYRVSDILILGLGCGTAAQIISRRFPKSDITGVEIDPVVIQMGRKYFGIDKIPNLRIINQDATEYISNFKNQKLNIHSKIKKEIKSFDLILVDMYKGEVIPSELESEDFISNLKSILTQNGTVIFNRIFWDEHKKEAYDFVKKAEKIFPQIELSRTVANLLVICR